MKRVVMLLLVAGTAAAQAPQTIAPGMSRADVVARLGAPLATRTLDGNTYLFSANGCEHRCGMQDIVVLDSDKVVDAIFRSPTRRYSGVSSSPAAVPLSEVRQAGAARQQGAPMVVPSRAQPADCARKPAVDSQVPSLRRQTSTTAPARSEIRIPMMGTPTQPTRGGSADTLRQPAQPARRQGD